jgi:hypothetical protein
VVARTVFVKLEAVLNFVHVLITWYSVEHRRNISLFKRLSDLGIQVKGETIRRNILNSAANLLKVMPRTGMYEHLTELDTFMENNSEITKSAVALRDDVLRVQI